MTGIRTGTVLIPAELRRSLVTIRPRIRITSVLRLARDAADDARIARQLLASSFRIAIDDGSGEGGRDVTFATAVLRFLVLRFGRFAALQSAAFLLFLFVVGVGLFVGFLRYRVEITFGKFPLRRRQIRTRLTWR